MLFQRVRHRDFVVLRHSVIVVVDVKEILVNGITSVTVSMRFRQFVVSVHSR